MKKRHIEIVTCPHCESRVKRLAMHIKFSHPDIVEQELEEEIVEVPVDTTIVTLHFNQPVEIYINGTAYIGKEVTVIGRDTADDVLRIAKETYGWEIVI